MFYLNLVNLKKGRHEKAYHHPKQDLMFEKLPLDQLNLQRLLDDIFWLMLKTHKTPSVN